MTIPELCTSISKNLSHNLRLVTTDEERQEYLALALQSLGSRVVPLLNQLWVEQGEGSPELEKARLATLDLATIIGIDFNRKCTNYRWGVSCLEEVAATCREPQVKRKLVGYTNQLKKRWNNVEPGGIIHTPRARHLKGDDNISFPLGSLLRSAIVLGIMVTAIIRMDLTSLVFPALNKPPPTSPPQVQTSEHQNEPPPAVRETPPPLPSPEPPLPTPPTGAAYTFTDHQGIVHMVDDLEKVPPEFRSRMKVNSAGANGTVTPVVIRGNQVLVPVRLSHGGRTEEALLLLDTGASITTINGRLANRLGVAPVDTRPGRATVADGRSVAAYHFTLDALAVGGRSVPQMQVSILPGSGGEGHDGLLGMNFLRQFRYHINFDRSIIQWGG